MRSFPALATLLSLLGTTLLSACGGGATSGLQPPPPEGPTTLSADNMLDATGVAYVADNQSYYDYEVLMQSLDSLRTLLKASGSAACPGGGSVTLDWQGEVWRYTAQNCKLPLLTLGSGSISIDSSQRASAGSKLSLKDLVLPGFYADAPQLVYNAQYQIELPIADVEGKSLSGAMSVSNGAATRYYENITHSRRPADASYQRRELNIRSPRFPYPLKLTVIETAQSNGRSFVVSAEDGSTLTVTELGTSRQLELRSAKSVVPLAIRTISAAELAAARSRARQ
ncbi:hypothetical protein RQP53_12870 [Paucibacter sp. APW11]|uniref:Lipoprotein n=1 Tax=Roseateles aquae TaxID=3077235 RepID=A0ABU3PCU6_9BURK|nr:hypothetical protein [Paucibacter sp. APW11]MDT9000162.1 hypothetical protein [Paucibacter sp. APW11]